MEENNEDFAACVRFLNEFNDATTDVAESKQCFGDDSVISERNIVLTEEELNAEVLSSVLQYLKRWKCPPVLSAALARAVVDLRSAVIRQFWQQCSENDFQDFDYGKLWKTVLGGLEEICREWGAERYADHLKTLTGSKEKISVCAIKNGRRKMEDRYVVIQDLNVLFDLKGEPPTRFYAVYDGHGGTDAASYSAVHLHCNIVCQPSYPSDVEKAMKEAFMQTDNNFLRKCAREGLRSGSTALCCLLRGTKLYVAWLGDSQAVVVRDGRVVDVMESHKPDRQDERERIESLGGCIVHFGTWRVNGTLAVSRAIGDVEYKPFVCSDADVVAIDLDGTEDFLVLACDGLWDVLQADDAVCLIYEYLRNGGNEDTVCEKLVQVAKEHGSTDNITVLVVFLRSASSISAEGRRPDKENVGLSDKEWPMDVLAGSPGDFIPSPAYSDNMSTSGSTTFAGGDAFDVSPSKEPDESGGGSSCVRSIQTDPCTELGIVAVLPETESPMGAFEETVQPNGVQYCPGSEERASPNWSLEGGDPRVPCHLTGAGDGGYEDRPGPVVAEEDLNPCFVKIPPDVSLPCFDSPEKDESARRTDEVADHSLMDVVGQAGLLAAVSPSAGQNGNSVDLLQFVSPDLLTWDSPESADAPGTNVNCSAAPLSHQSEIDGGRTDGGADDDTFLDRIPSSATVSGREFGVASDSAAADCAPGFVTDGGNDDDHHRAEWAFEVDGGGGGNGALAQTVPSGLNGDQDALLSLAIEKIPDDMPLAEDVEDDESEDGEEWKYYRTSGDRHQEDAAGMPIASFDAYDGDAISRSSLAVDADPPPASYSQFSGDTNSESQADMENAAAVVLSKQECDPELFVPAAASDVADGGIAAVSTETSPNEDDVRPSPLPKAGIPASKAAVSATKPVAGLAKNTTARSASASASRISASAAHSTLTEARRVNMARKSSMLTSSVARASVASPSKATARPPKPPNESQSGAPQRTAAHTGSTVRRSATLRAHGAESVGKPKVVAPPVAVGVSAPKFASRQQQQQPGASGAASTARRTTTGTMTLSRPKVGDASVAKSSLGTRPAHVSNVSHKEAADKESAKASLATSLKNKTDIKQAKDSVNKQIVDTAKRSCPIASSMNNNNNNNIANNKQAISSRYQKTSKTSVSSGEKELKLSPVSNACTTIKRNTLPARTVMTATTTRSSTLCNANSTLPPRRTAASAPSKKAVLSTSSTLQAARGKRLPLSAAAAAAAGRAKPPSPEVFPLDPASNCGDVDGGNEKGILDAADTKEIS